MALEASSTGEMVGGKVGRPVVPGSGVESGPTGFSTGELSGVGGETGPTGLSVGELLGVEVGELTGVEVGGLMGVEVGELTGGEVGGLTGVNVGSGKTGLGAGGEPRRRMLDCVTGQEPSAV